MPDMVYSCFGPFPTLEAVVMYLSRPLPLTFWELVEVITLACFADQWLTLHQKAMNDLMRVISLTSVFLLCGMTMRVT